MRCVIQKFGGACLTSKQRLFRVARKLLASRRPTVAVVSARQGATDRLLGQMHGLGGTGPSPALDLLLATGELQSAALLAAAVSQLGGKAMVAPPWLVFQTDGVWGDATIRKVDVRLVRQYMKQGMIPIVPGFLGGAADGAITTLGRGGSDYSAVALGVALGARRVELYKAEVDGVYDADPHTHQGAKRFEDLTHAEALRLAQAGAKVLQAKAAALACNAGIRVVVRPAFARGRGTVIHAARECAGVQ
jgi:aspartate kinase